MTEFLKQYLSLVVYPKIPRTAFFLIFVNGLPKEMTECEAFSFADDFKLVTLMSEKIQKDLSKMEDWCNANKMKLNKGKCLVLYLDFKKVFHRFLLTFCVKP